MTTEPTVSADEVERVARAICLCNCDNADADATGKKVGDEGFSPEWLYYQADARAAIAALSPPRQDTDEKTAEEVDYEVWQTDRFGEGDVIVAGSTSLAEAQHYAVVYGQDGPTWVVEVTRRCLPTTKNPESSHG